jgi:hypothetical protein
MSDRSSRTVEWFGWLDLVLGLIILIAPRQVAALFRLPALVDQDVSDLHFVGTLVCVLGLLYIVSGRLKAQGFTVASLLDRPLVPFVMAVLWWMGIVPGVLAIAFSVIDFSGFLWTLLAWRSETQAGLHPGGPDLPPQSRAGRALEILGILDVVTGLVIVIGGTAVAGLLQVDAPMIGAPSYLRLAGLLTGGIGMLYVISGAFSARGTVIASLMVRPFVVIVLFVLRLRGPIGDPLFYGGAGFEVFAFLWTFIASWIDRHHPATGRAPLLARAIAALFGFVSSVRNARTFHPDGRVFLGTVQSEKLGGRVLMRIGMGLMKRGMPPWLAYRIPDAPSIACRFFDRDGVPLERRPGDDLDLLCTAGGDRLWKLVINLATGGHKYGLRQFDYFANEYFAQVPYRIDGGTYWIRIVPDGRPRPSTDGRSREQALTDAVAARATLRVEMQRAGDPSEPFVPIGTIRFEEEIEIDQETLHFDPVDGRGFAPHGFFTGLRKVVYPASVGSRPATIAERETRENDLAVHRAGRHLARRWAAVLGLAALIIAGAAAIYLLLRFTRDVPVDYTEGENLFMHGSTGGERRNGIPYWYWVALPELFPELLPDPQPGQGYASFGLVYKEGADKRYALPYGVSMRNFRGIDVVYLNCGACHIGSVRERPGGKQEVYAGMPAHQFDLGAFGNFLTSVPASQKFTGVRLLDQIRKMENNRHRAACKPDWINTLLLKYVAAHLMREQLIILGERLKFIQIKTWGPGRVDTFNAPKALLNFPMDHAPESEKLGNADFPSVWNQAPREGMHLHWDGNNILVRERNLSAAFGTGAYPGNLDTARVVQMQHYLDTAKPKPYPFPKDKVLAQKGAPLYAQYCAGCHGTRERPFDGKYVGKVVPIDQINTDRRRLDSYTWELAVNQSTLYAGFERDWGFPFDYPQRFHEFRKTNGYANSPLDGIWLRAPYLHNGSVPNLCELLKPAKDRTRMFWNGNDVYDQRNVGFVSDVPAWNGHAFFPIDTTVLTSGNTHTGHEDRPDHPLPDGLSYGTNLGAGEKWALIEYLKTF